MFLDLLRGKLLCLGEVLLPRRVSLVELLKVVVRLIDSILGLLSVLEPLLELLRLHELLGQLGLAFSHAEVLFNSFDDILHNWMLLRLWHLDWHLD